MIGTPFFVDITYVELRWNIVTSSCTIKYYSAQTVKLTIHSLTNAIVNIIDTDVMSLDKMSALLSKEAEENLT